MTDIYSLFKNMERDDIILSFKGDITQDLLSSVYQIMESRMDNEQEDIRRKKKFYYILVECLQNVYHHMESLQDEKSKAADNIDGSAIFIVGKGDNESYRIITGNFIMNEKANDLKVKLDKINSMNAEELRAYYLEKLSSTELSEKGGAGLGMIDMARKSGHKMDYHFHSVSEKYSFFSLAVTVK
ncbi:MAG: SiaB family protein kinase [Bacteroidia bacterium]